MTLILFFLSAGCVGIGAPNLPEMKPYSLIRGGDQLGRDQLANRLMAANAKVLLKGRNSNEVLTFLGQPQQIEVTKRNIAENWYFVYYQKYKTWPNTKQGLFVVRFLDGKVEDVTKLTTEV